ncbi:hypothetical protein BSn5_20585 [Bacillus subtilis BSn5]|nr:hypothetical protein BSn5_20585 [Bacillus subtilis BSn5]
MSEILVKLAILTFAGQSSFHVPNAIHPKEERQSFLIQKLVYFIVHLAQFSIILNV